MSMRTYFDDTNANPQGVTYTNWFMYAVGAVGILAAALVLFGWVALGERIDISRRHLNGQEWFAMIAGIILCYGGIRTAMLISQRNRSGWAWAQWTSFATTLMGYVILLNTLAPQLLSMISNVRPIVPEEALFTLEFAAGRRDVTLFFSALMLFGLALVIGGTWVYNYVTSGIEVDDSKVEKAQGAFSTDISDMTPLGLIQYQLSQSAGAGAIIGFVLIFLIFSTATEKFLEPTSIASMLTNISTRGWWRLASHC